MLKADQHSQNFPEAGLSPESPVVVSDQDWLKATSTAWPQKITEELKQAWVSRFCLPEMRSPKETEMSERELQHRCAQHVESVVPAELKQFYFKNWGITFAQLKNIIQ